MTRVRCPAQRQARHGLCEAPGCDHYAGTRQRICRCCLYRCGLAFADMMFLAWKYKTPDQYRDLEDGALVKLAALPPPMKPVRSLGVTP